MFKQHALLEYSQLNLILSKLPNFLFLQYQVQLAAGESNQDYSDIVQRLQLSFNLPTLFLLFIY